MRHWVLGTAAAIVLPASPAFASDHLLFGAPEPWVVPVAAPAPPAADDTSAFTNLLDDEQAMLGKGERRFYSDSVYRINSPQGLDDGNVSVTWDPATETVTVNKLLLRRGSQVIDVLKSGQSFTTMRRETNLEAGMLDGRLTATLLPEGLQVGDIVEFAVTFVHKDPTTKDSTEVDIGDFNGSPIGRGFARLSWPASLPVNFKTNGGLEAPKITTKDGISSIQYDMTDIEPLVLPDSAPARFRLGRGVNASSFTSWNEVAALMKPYFEAAAVIPPSGPLRDEVERIRRLPGGDKVRAEAALKLVENSIRYVALSMGTGGYIPASAQTTWERRFGDCKAKTALLIAILHELHMQAEPVLANTDGNDGLDRFQPQVGWFNHVLVRAHIDGRDYWLDGTRSGDNSIDQLQTPAYDWGLPLVSNASLVRMVPDPLRDPSIEVALSIDAHEGIHVKAPTKIAYIFRGDEGLRVNLKYNATPPSQRDRLLRDFFKKVAGDWKNSFVSLDPDKVEASYDVAKGEMRYNFTGTGTLDWADNNFYVEFASVAYKPNFQRTEGINRDAPLALDFPSFVKVTESIQLPPSFNIGNTKIADIDSTLVGTQYHRHISASGNMLTVEESERTIVPEVPYQEAMASTAGLRELNSKQLQINVPDNYTPSEKDLAAWTGEKLATESQFMDRGNALLTADRYDDAIADFNHAIDLNSKNQEALTQRAWAYVLNGDTDHAKADVQAASALGTPSPHLNRVLGYVAEQDGDWQAAIDAYSRSLTKEPDNSFAIGHRGIALAALNRDDDALKDTATALAGDPSWYDLRRVRAAIFVKRHQCGDELKEAQAVVDNAGDSSSALATGARLFASCQQRDEGLALLGKAIAKKPTAFMYINRASLRLPEDHAGRIADIDQAIKLEPKSTNWLAFKADELDRTGDHAGAEQYYAQALKLKPDDFMLALNRAVIVYRLGRTAEATKLLTDLRGRAKEAILLNNMCWAKATAGIMLQSALSDCQEALKMRPGLAGYLDSLGMTYLKLGRYDEAIAAYDKAIAGGSGAVSLIGRAAAYAKTGKADLAAADRKAALADDPDIGALATRYQLGI